MTPLRGREHAARRVLFVDDETRILDGLRRNLQGQRQRWQMSFVDSAAAAMAALERDRFDVVVTDFRMPGMDGGQLLRIVQERWPDTSRLMLSGHTDAADLLDAMAVTHRFLDKPCERTLLVDAIEGALFLRDAFVGDALRGEIGGIATLPSGDGTLQRLARALDRPSSTLREVSDVVQTDVGLTVKVLQLANSSCFGGGHETASVDQALTTIGLPAVRGVTLMRELFIPARNVVGLSQSWLNRLNQHACLTGQVARRLVGPALATEAFCAAVVEECGQLAFAACRPHRLDAVLNRSHGEQGELSRLEHDEFGVGHAAAGAYLLSLWGFPATVVAAVGEHDLLPAAYTEAHLGVADAVRVARLVVGRHVTGVCPAPWADDTAQRWLDDPRCHVDLLGEADTWLPGDPCVTPPVPA